MEEVANRMDSYSSVCLQTLNFANRNEKLTGQPLQRIGSAQAVD